MSGLSVGAKVPEFTLKDQAGKPQSFYKDILSKGAAMIVFYPGDFTMVCTKQLCSYRDHLSDFRDLGIQVVGVSKNSVEDHSKFAGEYGFQFALLSDENKDVAREFGTASFLTIGGVNRAVFIVSSKGELLYRHVEVTNILHRNSDELLDVIRNLREKKQI